MDTLVERRWKVAPASRSRRLGVSLIPASRTPLWIDALANSGKTWGGWSDGWVRDADEQARLASKTRAMNLGAHS